jgi:hypothetical protein
MNNSATMDEYLEDHLPATCEVVMKDGSYAEVLYNSKLWGVNASGDGDFHNHMVRIELLQEGYIYED